MYFLKFKSRDAALVIFSIGAAMGLVAFNAFAATTISTNIQTDGTLSVTGTSTLTGNVGVNQSSPSYPLDVNGAGHFTGLVDAANLVATSSTATSTFAGGLTVSGETITGGTNGMTIEPAGYAGYPREAFGAPATTTSGLGQIQFTTLDSSGVSITRYGGQYGTNLKLQVAGGTQSAPTAYGSLAIAGLNFQGYNGTDFATAANITVDPGGGFSSTNSGSPFLVINTAADGSTGMASRITIDSEGNVGIGGIPGIHWPYNPSMNMTATLQVAASSTNATTTVELGKSGQNKGTCLVMYDAQGTAQYVTVQGGTLVVSSTSCK